MMTDQSVHSDLAVPPGEYLEEVLEELGMTKDELAKRMDRPAPKLSAIFKGEKAITPDTALRLERVVGVPAHIWIGLETEYRLALARAQEVDEQVRLKAESKLLTHYRYADLAKMGEVGKVSRPVDKVRELLNFFGVTSLKTVPSLRRYQPAFRSGKFAHKGYQPEAVVAWLRIGERAAAKRHCQAFDRGALREALAAIRSMTLQPPEQFQPRLQQLLADCGVALVICPHMPSTGIHGATFWLGPGKAVVMMSIRYKWADIFWFSLFHELGHILLHGHTTVILEGVDGDPKLKEQEDQADRFAADTLIPPGPYKKFTEKGRFYAEVIQQFADRVDIAPGIVVGRLQNDGLLRRSWHNGIRRRFEWRQEIPAPNA